LTVKYSKNYKRQGEEDIPYRQDKKKEKTTTSLKCPLRFTGDKSVNTIVVVNISRE